MKKARIALLALIPLFLLIACAPASAPAAAPREVAPAAAPRPAAPVAVVEPWKATWEKTLEEAKKEGKVVVYGTPGAEVRAAMSTAFRAKFGIPAEFVTGRGGEIAERMVTEHRVGLRLADIYTGGITSALTLDKPAGVFAPLEPTLILPEVTDPKMWVEGGVPWVDEDKMIIGFLRYVVPPLAINTELIKPDEIKSYRDLLQPKWKGKMSLQDPTAPGTGTVWFGVVGLYAVNYDYIRELAKQEPVITLDRRLQIEWVAKGKYPVAIAPHSQTLTEFMKAGAPIKWLTPQEGTHTTTGGGGLALITGAPHPNAAKLFINWLLGKEGLLVYSRAALLPTHRLDLPTDFVDPINLPQPGMKFFRSDDEKFTLGQPDRIKLARDIFKLK